MQTIKSVELLMLSVEHAKKLFCMHEENKTLKERTKDEASENILIFPLQLLER